MKDNVDKASAEVDAQLLQVVASEQLESHWIQSKQHRQALAQAVAAGQLAAADRNRQHTQIITTILRLYTEVIDRLGPMTDPSRDTRDLIQASFNSAPWLTEKLGTMRAMGSGLSTRGSLPSQDKGVWIGLKDPQEAQKAQVDNTLTMADKNLIKADITFPAMPYFDDCTRTIDPSTKQGGLTVSFARHGTNNIGRLLDVLVVMQTQLNKLMSAVRTDALVQASTAATGNLRQQAQQLLQAAQVFKTA